MCLAVPGKILSIDKHEELWREGLVSFDGLQKKINLSYVPEVVVGDYVLVHVGIAISRIDNELALETLADLRGYDETP